MGSTVCQAVAGDPELELVAAVDPSHSGIDVRQVTGASVDHLQIAPDPSGFTDSLVDVAVDFTEPSAAMGNIRWCAEHGVHSVVGTSGLGDSDLEEVRSLFEGGRSNCIIAPNFAIGAVLLVRMAEIAAPYFDTAEIIELHHDNKKDAPSGTAMHTAERMAAASKDWAPDPTTVHTVEGARGGKGPGGIPIHAVRMRGMVAHEEVLLGTMGQTLSLRHDSYDRTSFMPGVLLACKAVADRPGLTVGLDALLF